MDPSESCCVQGREFQIPRAHLAGLGAELPRALGDRDPNFFQTLCDFLAWRADAESAPGVLRCTAPDAAQHEVSFRLASGAFMQAEEEADGTLKVQAQEPVMEITYKQLAEDEPCPIHGVLFWAEMCFYQAFELEMAMMSALLRKLLKVMSSMYEAIRQLADSRSEEAAAFLNGCQQPGGVGYADGLHLSPDAMPHLVELLEPFLEDVAAVFSDSALCSVRDTGDAFDLAPASEVSRDRTEQHSENSQDQDRRGQVAAAVLGAVPLHPVAGRGLRGIGQELAWKLSEGEFLPHKSKQRPVGYEWTWPRQLREAVEGMLEACSEKGLALHLLDIVPENDIQKAGEEETAWWDDWEQQRERGMIVAAPTVSSDIPVPAVVEYYCNQRGDFVYERIREVREWPSTSVDAYYSYAMALLMEHRLRYALTKVGTEHILGERMRKPAIRGPAFTSKRTRLRRRSERVAGSSDQGKVAKARLRAPAELESEFHQLAIFLSLTDCGCFLWDTKLTVGLLQKMIYLTVGFVGMLAARSGKFEDHCEHNDEVSDQTAAGDDDACDAHDAYGDGNGADDDVADVDDDCDRSDFADAEVSAGSGDEVDSDKENVIKRVPLQRQAAEKIDTSAPYQRGGDAPAPMVLEIPFTDKVKPKPKLSSDSRGSKRSAALDAPGEDMTRGRRPPAAPCRLESKDP
ncbi:hypothetical protein AK812_SmicGene22993 [Symbiodinium microadriaticum]|uniref:Uncharacterized protein n=1 Tax=Symbiodinium microadriaticum TaxID=2951 RepID=A0A1Q9DID9_SYMMI|nr:hypothetical protein AK812_SmicGene22993 [Symbiodinium microadriaticum]